MIKHRAYSFGHLLKTVELVDFPDFRSLFTKAHSFGHSVFGRLPRDF